MTEERPNSTDSKKPPLATPLSFCAVSFAAFLTILNMGDRGSDSVLAAELFAVGIPLTLVTIAMSYEPTKYKKGGIAWAGVGLTIGACAMLAGIYFCFSEVSDSAGNYFLSTVAICIILIAMSTKPVPPSRN